ncbi:MAG TPA: T9SS type A sorting domain-containing protein, partial [Flavobacterium sp.]|nr:T9SS type A sorting domain-containing protein [Flavobacterium sp.]
AVPFNVPGTVLANQDQEVVSLSLFPNPVSSSLNINSSVPVTGIELFDLTGRKVKSIKGDDIRTVVLSELPSGTYMVNLKTVSGRLVKKIVKQ